MPVYFVQAGRYGPIKIGFANNPESRLTFLQTGHYETLRIVAVMPGTQEEERGLHHKFAEHRIRGEWFGMCSGIAMLIETFAVTVREPVAIDDMEAPDNALPVIGTIDALVSSVGSQTKLARLLGMSPQALHNARSRGALQRRDAVKHRHILTNHGLNVSWKIWGIEERAA